MELLKFLANFIVESDAIEEIQADPLLVKVQLEEGMDKGHVGALLLLESLAQKSREVLSEEVVCQVQGLITAEQHTKLGGSRLESEWVGHYRTVGVSIGGRIAPKSDLVPSLMLTWIGKVTAWQRECLPYIQDQNLREIARYHFEYEYIHPFVDGNGRSGRALVYYFLRYCRVQPFIFSNSDKYETYYNCFNNPEAMCRYFISKSKIRELVLE